MEIVGKNEVLKTVDNTFFEQMQSFLASSIHKIKRMNYPNNEDIQIFIPEYLVKMFNHYLHAQLTGYRLTGMDKFMGVKIYDNYRNSVVVRHKDSLLYNMETFELPII